MHTRALRVEVIAAMAPAVRHLVLTGQCAAHDGFPVVPSIAADCCLATELAEDARLNRVLAHAVQRAAIEQGMHILKTEGSGSSNFALRPVPLEEPPSIDAGKIADKRYIDQRAALLRRQTLVRALRADPPSAAVIRI